MDAVVSAARTLVGGLDLEFEPDQRDFEPERLSGTDDFFVPLFAGGRRFSLPRAKVDERGRVPDRFFDFHDSDAGRNGRLSRNGVAACLNGGRKPVLQYFRHGGVAGKSTTARILQAVLRDGTVFQLPGIVIRVAQECSGIRSSWVLFVTSILASHLFLKSPWRRALLVAFVIPLGILRNGFRIVVIGLLCVHVGPEMIHSIIHRRGGPFFFALSLIPLFLVLWWLRRTDVGDQRMRVEPAESPLAVVKPLEEPR